MPLLTEAEVLARAARMTTLRKSTALESLTETASADATFDVFLSHSSNEPENLLLGIKGYLEDSGLPARVVAQLLSPASDELVAMRAAITELERIGMTTEAANLRGLDRKVRALIPAESEIRLAVDEEALLEAMGYAARPGPRPATNAIVDAAVSQALKGPFHLAIEYQSRGETGPSWRTVAPFGLLLGERRYLVGKDLAKADGRLRHYRVEDIASAEIQTTSFEFPADFDLGEYAQRAFGSYHNESEYGEVVWRFTPAASDRAQRFLFHPMQQTEELEDGSLIVRFEASGHLEMAWHLYAWGTAVKVLSPPSLAAMVNPYRRDDFAALP